MTPLSRRPRGAPALEAPARSRRSCSWGRRPPPGRIRSWLAGSSARVGPAAAALPTAGMSKVDVWGAKLRERPIEVKTLTVQHTVPTTRSCRRGTTSSPADAGPAQRPGAHQSGGRGPDRAIAHSAKYRAPAKGRCRCAERVSPTWSHKGRVRSEAAFARLAGVAPIPASSGQTTRFRLSRGGDRQLNRALHTVILHRRLHDPTTKAYIETTHRRRENEPRRRPAPQALARPPPPPRPQQRADHDLTVIGASFPHAGAGSLSVVSSTERLLDPFAHRRSSVSPRRRCTGTWSARRQARCRSS